jgi:hypothetical protein
MPRVLKKQACVVQSLRLASDLTWRVVFPALTRLVATDGGGTTMCWDIGAAPSSGPQIHMRPAHKIG